MVQVGVRRHAEIGIFRRMIAMTSEAQCLLELLDLFCENATCRVGMPRARRRCGFPQLRGAERWTSPIFTIPAPPRYANGTFLSVRVHCFQFRPTPRLLRRGTDCRTLLQEAEHGSARHNWEQSGQ